MTQPNIYFDRIRNTVDRIEKWFSGTDSSDALYEKLIADFAADFTMITMGGTTLGYAELCRFFKTHSNAKPGLKITLDSMAIVYEGLDGAVITYQEIQEQPAHEPTKRFATAFLEKNQKMQMRWKHLHETSVV